MLPYKHIKKFILVFVLMLEVFFSFAQMAMIKQFTIEPQQPTDQDSITFYVENEFSSGGCAVSYSSVMQSAQMIKASALHCTGMLTFICSYTDTFKIGPLSAGTYNFEMTLSTGMGGPPCSPGIVPNDIDTFSFTVSSFTGIKLFDNEEKILSINPVYDKVYFNRNISGNISIFNRIGNLVYSCYLVNKNELGIEFLSDGIYFFQIKNNTEIISGKLVKGKY